MSIRRPGGFASLLFLLCLPVAGLGVDKGKDVDRDGVPDKQDRCPATPKSDIDSRKIDRNGCGKSQRAIPTPTPRPIHHVSPAIGTMVSVPAGDFLMGSPPGEHDRQFEKGQRTVHVEAFRMDATEVTQGQYDSVMVNKPSWFRGCGRDCPVENVTWTEADDYCHRKQGRLPSEAEWEYAARAGSMTAWWWGSTENGIDRYAWWDGNSGGKTHPVGQKKANDWGLYDMAGNVREWTSDWYGDYPSGEHRNPEGPTSKSARGYRGGSWGDDPVGLRSAKQDFHDPSIRLDVLGFRCVYPEDTVRWKPSPRPDSVVASSPAIGKMVRIPAGTFQMGSPPDELSREESEEQHLVHVDSFKMDATEVTQGQYDSVMGEKPSLDSACGDDCPVENVTWREADDYCRRLGKRLPTEVEWEYAARAGSTTAWWWGSTESGIDRYAWHEGNSGVRAHPVGRKQANRWGLYDMAGNVMELTSDVRFPKTPTKYLLYVVRGGSFFDSAKNLRSAWRFSVPPDARLGLLGFRCVSLGTRVDTVIKPVVPTRADTVFKERIQGLPGETGPLDGASRESDEIPASPCPRPRSSSPAIGQMVEIGFDSFQMGSPGGERGRESDEMQHIVKVGAFKMDATEVTQGQYDSVMGTNPSNFSACGDDCPVEGVSWEEADNYCLRLGKRLPTEAEWEWAARGGSTTAWWWGSTGNEVDRYAWYDGNSGDSTHPVGQKEANGFGLYDMAGNVAEWTSDWYGVYPSEVQWWPIGPSSGTAHVLRGGGVSSSVLTLRSARRSSALPGVRARDLGFRCVIPL